MALNQMENMLSLIALVSFAVSIVFGGIAMKRILVPGGGR
jgi:hypothetical protein